MALEANVRNYIIPELGDLLISEVTKTSIRAFNRRLITSNSRRGTLLSKSSVEKIHATVSWALQSLVESGRLSTNPAWGCRPVVRKSERYRPSIWTPEELWIFLEHVRSDDLAALWNLLALTGMRRSEALGLHWADFSQDLRYVAVRRALIKAGDKLYVTAPKAAASRRVDLLLDTTQWLRRHRRLQQGKRRRAGMKPISGRNYVFLSRNLREVDPQWVSKRFRTLVKLAEVPQIRLHDLRHTHASHLLEAGANVKAVQERLGHAFPGFTMDTYLHLVPTIQAEAVRALRRFYR